MKNHNTKSRRRRCKLAGDVTPKFIKLIDRAAELDGRSRAAFMRWHLKIKAREIIKKNKSLGVQEL